MFEWNIFTCLIAILAFIFGTLGYFKGWNEGFDEGSELSERKLDLALKMEELKRINEKRKWKF